MNSNAHLDMEYEKKVIPLYVPQLTNQAEDTQGSDDVYYFFGEKAIGILVLNVQHWWMQKYGPSQDPHPKFKWLFRQNIQRLENQRIPGLELRIRCIRSYMPNRVSWYTISNHSYWSSSPPSWYLDCLLNDTGRAQECLMKPKLACGMLVMGVLARFLEYSGRVIRWRKAWAWHIFFCG